MTDKFEQWGIVELMGRNQCGANMLRVDVPDGESFRTVYYGGSAIYALHVTSEEVARNFVKRAGSAPPFAWAVTSNRLPAPSTAEDFEDEPSF